MRGVQSIDRLARIYESRWWYPLVLNLYGGWGCITLAELVDTIGNMLEPGTGRIIDVACGPGTFGRRLASESNEIFGIDISRGMLLQGASYAEKEQVYNIHFSRAQVEALPFKNNFFDAAICCGALHLFEDPVKALKEINRTMKEGASFAAFTFFAGDAGILRFRRIREHVRKDHGAHIFEIPEIENYAIEAGFEMFKPKMYGSVLVFNVRKASRV
jgi:ubiquinone/menaquinone biosynthesis C-methylase UbiE